MLLYFPKEEHEHLIFFDTEFDDQRLVQIAMILYEKILVETTVTYLLKGSVNLYINRNISRFFTEHTGITEIYITNNGVEEDEARNKINYFLDGLNKPSTMFISHGIKQDMTLLLDFGIKIDAVERYCTYNNARRLLKRQDKLKLIDVCNESGYFTDQHDAYTDSKNVVHAYSYLKLIEATTLPE